MFVNLDFMQDRDKIHHSLGTLQFCTSFKLVVILQL